MYVFEAAFQSENQMHFCEPTQRMKEIRSEKGLITCGFVRDKTMNKAFYLRETDEALPTEHCVIVYVARMIYLTKTTKN